MNFWIRLKILFRNKECKSRPKQFIFIYFLTKTYFSGVEDILGVSNKIQWDKLRTLNLFKLFLFIFILLISEFGWDLLCIEKISNFYLLF